MPLGKYPFVHFIHHRISQETSSNITFYVRGTLFRALPPVPQLDTAYLIPITQQTPFYSTHRNICTKRTQHLLYLILSGTQHRQNPPNQHQLPHLRSKIYHPADTTEVFSIKTFTLITEFPEVYNRHKRQIHTGTGRWTLGDNQYFLSFSCNDLRKCDFVNLCLCLRIGFCFATAGS